MSKISQTIRAILARYDAAVLADDFRERPLWMAPERPKPSRKPRSSKPPEQPDPAPDGF